MSDRATHGKRPTPAQPTPLDTPARPHLAPALSHVQSLKSMSPPSVSSTPTTSHHLSLPYPLHPPTLVAQPPSPTHPTHRWRWGSLSGGGPSPDPALWTSTSAAHVATPSQFPTGHPSLPFPPSTHRASVSMKSSAASQAVGTASAWSGEAASSLASGGSVVWTSLGPLPRWIPGPTTWWAPGTTRLVPHGT
jgi:hypothetical protein